MDQSIPIGNREGRIGLRIALKDKGRLAQLVQSILVYTQEGREDSNLSPPTRASRFINREGREFESLTAHQSIPIFNREGREFESLTTPVKAVPISNRKGRSRVFETASHQSFPNSYRQGADSEEVWRPPRINQGRSNHFPVASRITQCAQ